jgi:hypothetical protein
LAPQQAYISCFILGGLMVLIGLMSWMGVYNPDGCSMMLTLSSLLVFPLLLG